MTANLNFLMEAMSHEKADAQDQAGLQGHV
jgi:hypothetical protein